MKALDKIFYFTYRFGQKLLEISKISGCAFWVGMGLTVVTCNFNLCVSVFFCVVSVILLFAGSADNLMSVRKFLSIGLLYWFTITLFVIVIVNPNFDISGYIIVFSIFAIMWCMYSLIANNKVATVANQIISTILACIVLLKDTIISFIPDIPLDIEPAAGYTSEKLIELTFNLAFNPVLAINLFAMLLCTLKGYWIEKYNDNKDLGYQEPEDTDWDNTENKDIEKETTEQDIK